MTIDWLNFSPWSALLGGAMIGGAAVLLLRLQGRILGVSGMLYSSLLQKQWQSWRIGVLAGLLIAPWVYLALGGELPQLPSPSIPLLLIAGFLVGFGSRLGSGCTSGHGVCGIARLSVRSLVATGLFMLTGFLTVYVMRHLLGLI